jgi:hypothetical protein
VKYVDAAAPRGAPPGRIELGPVAELAGTEVLGRSPDAVLDVVAAYVQLLPAGPYTTKGHMHMWMLGVVVQGGTPLQPRGKVLFHSSHRGPRQTFKIQPIPKFRRQDQLPKELIFAGLPLVQPCGDIDAFLGLIESALFRIGVDRGGFAGYVPTVRSPLTTRGVPCVCHTDGTALKMGFHADSRRPLGVRLLPATAHPGVVHDSLESDRPDLRLLL